MIDLHTHILPSLDDGAKTLKESIQMCWISFRDGVRTIVATPHILRGIYENDRATILSKTHELNEEVKQFEVRSSEFRVKDSKLRNSFFSSNRSGLLTQNSELSLKILPGADVHFSSDLLQLFERKEIVTVNDQGRYLMVEFAFQGIPHQAEEILFQLLTRDVIPIISHPERNMEIRQRPKRYYEMIRMGCLGQVTAMSLTGEFGPGIRRIAEELLSKRLIHIIASDAHSTDGRPPILSAAVKAAEKIVGEREAQKMVTEYPQAILRNRRPDVPEPLSS